MLTLNALCAATEVLIPLQAHFLALHGLSKLLETINLVSKRVNRDLKVAGVVLCLYDAGTRLGGEVIDDLEPVLRRPASGGSVALGRRAGSSRRGSAATSAWPSARASASRSSSTPPSSRGAEDYASLAAEVQGRAPPPLWQVAETVKGTGDGTPEEVKAASQV